MNRKRQTRGAALIVALAILVVLLALAITFFTTSRLEVQVATNVEEQLRTELLANGGLAIAIAFLQHDLIQHPTYTSLDHAWRSYFSGAWAAGKPWMFPRGCVEPTDPEGRRRLWSTLGPDLDGDGLPDPRGPGIPVVSLTAIALNDSIPVDPVDGRPLYATEITNDWMYLPIQMPRPDAVFPPLALNRSGVDQFDRSTTGYFVKSAQVAENPAAGLGIDPAQFVPDAPASLAFRDPVTGAVRDRLVSELVDIWADVDNTGDGVRDAMWIPVPQDIDFSDDGIDNDLNGVIDNEGEVARFIYWGGADGRDNSCTCTADDVADQRIFLTAPMVVNGVPVINNLNLLEAGAINPARLQEKYGIPNEDVFDEFGTLVQRGMFSLLNDPTVWTVTSAYGHPSVDCIDNDHDFVEGNARTVDLTQLPPGPIASALGDASDPLELAAALGEFRDLFPIAPQYVGGNPFIFSSGEPVTEIVGRLAITITDEASRVDIGSIGGFARDTTLTGSPVGRVRSINEGASTFEYEPRVLPAFGPQRSVKLWNLAMGAPQGLTNEFLPDGQPLTLPEFTFDIRHPGYGLTDDNGNAFRLAMDGIDNDGTGLIDPVFRLGSPADPPAVRARYIEKFGFPLALEGLDEPSEFRRFRPHRNRIAEANNRNDDPRLRFTWDGDNEVVAWEIDPTAPQIVDQVGELGDTVFRSKEQIKDIVANERFVSGQALYDIVRNQTTVHATQRTERRKFTDAFGRAQFVEGSRIVPERGDITGPRIDLNYASVDQIFTALTEDFGYPSLYEEYVVSLDLPDAPRREDFPTDSDHRLAQLQFAEAVVGVPLFALGLGVEGIGFQGSRVTGLGAPPLRGLARNISSGPFGASVDAWAADDRLRAAQMAVNIADFRDRDHNRTTFTFTVPDLWWELEQRLRGIDEGDLEQREIEYTVAGIESIRINEIMARATRRVEAEMLYGIGNVTSRWYLQPSIAANQSPGEYDPPDLAARAGVGGVITTDEFIFSNYNPNYFSVIPGEIPNVPAYEAVDPRYRAEGFPDFRMTQRAFAWWTGADVFLPNPVDPINLPPVVNNPDSLYNPVQPPATVAPSPTFGVQNTAQAEAGWERVWSKERILGNETALFTREAEIERNLPGIGTLQGPNFMEFEFLPGPGLPPGRYYLKLNTLLDGNVTVENGDQLRFAIKYDLPGRGFIGDISEAVQVGGVAAAQDLLDIIDANGQPAIAWRDLSTYTGDPFNPGDDPVFFAAQKGIPDDGTVFFPFAPGDFSPEYQALFLAGLPASLNPFDSLTVSIPNYVRQTLGDAPLALHVAVWKADPDGEPLAINYFEFSQEPAHEWVEIVNVAEGSEPIDLSGWVLEVGHPNDEGFEIFDPSEGVLSAFEPLRRRFRVPDGTQIAPGGKLLLGFSKFDYLGVPTGPGEIGADIPPINRNGMALANTAFLPNLLDPALSVIVGLDTPEPTVPPIPMGDPRFANSLWPMGPPLGTPEPFTIGLLSARGNELPGSVFRRILYNTIERLPFPETLIDFVDDRGDGLDDLLSGLLDDAFAIDPALRPEELGASTLFASTPFDLSATAPGIGDTPNKPFDRIVQLEPLDGATQRFMALDDRDSVAATVLAGGVFPNYPDRDGRDNNLTGSLPTSPLLTDGINNNMSTAPGVDNFVTALNQTGDSVIWQSEGFDQGRPGQYRGTELPAAGSYSRDPIGYEGVFRNVPAAFPNRTFDGDGTLLVTGALELPNKLVGNSQRLQIPGRPDLVALTSDEPAFKAFLERRWNPGDVVKVTLYTGRPDEERIADRVTYTERDVVNRSIHDGIASPYVRVGIDPLSGDVSQESASLDPRFPSMWPDDTMGVDFYRSLERKHPLYTGDLFGLANRWTATDGNYDDWGAGWGKKDANIVVDARTGLIETNGGFVTERAFRLNGNPGLSSWTNALGLDLRWSGFAGVDPTQDIKVGHQFEASPLRMNFKARQYENPAAPEPRPEFEGRQFTFAESGFAAAATADPYAFETPLLPGVAANNLQRWTWQKPRVRNRPLASPGDLMTLPSVQFLRRMWPVSTLISGVGSTPGSVITISESGREPYGVETDRVLSVLMGEQRKRDLTAATASALMEPVELSAAQANVYFLTPTAPSGAAGPEGVPSVEGFDIDVPPTNGDWPTGTILTDADSFPTSWTPVMFYSLPADGVQLLQTAPVVDARSQVSVPIRTNVLMDTARTNSDADFFFGNRLPQGFTTADLARRSTLRTRVAFYAAGNPVGVDRFSLAAGGPTDAPAEVLFEWTAESGLENGDYEVYVVTAEPLDGLAEYARIVLDPDFLPVDLVGASESEINNWRSRQRRLAETLTPTALAVLQAAEASVPSALPVDVEILTDRDGNRRVWSGLYPTPGDFRTGVDGDARNPESAGLLKRAVPDSQGVIHYGPVRVENNYLALRLRNWAAPGRLNRFSRVVLAPTNRVRGRVNLNTVATVRDPNTLSNRPGPVPGLETVVDLPLFNPLQGLPGVITASYDTPFDLDRLRLNVDPIRQISVINQRAALGTPPINIYDRSIRLADQVERLRPDWGDGRYYRYPSDMVAWEQRVAWPNRDHDTSQYIFATSFEGRETEFARRRNIPYGNDYPHYPAEATAALAAAGFPIPPEAGGQGLDPRINQAPLLVSFRETGDNEYGYPPTNQTLFTQYARNNARFDEGRFRFSRMGNLVTTRSDVFEIVVTAQSGYVPTAGERGEGTINYRNEFIVQGEKRIRVVYER